MNNKAKINCHDCGKSVTVTLNKDDEFEIDEIEVCPFCGSDNIELEGK